VRVLWRRAAWEFSGQVFPSSVLATCLVRVIWRSASCECSGALQVGVIKRSVRTSVLAECFMRLFWRSASRECSSEVPCVSFPARSLVRVFSKMPRASVLARC
jgi:hypothetical protein